jgi:hypothetical protein
MGFLGILIEKEIFWVKINRDVEVKLEFKNGQTVVIVAVGENNGLRKEFLFQNGGADEVSLVARIDDDSFSSVFVCH